MQHKKIIISVFRQLWSENPMRLKVFTVLAFCALICSKGINVLIPIIFKSILDGISDQLLSLPVLLLLAYGSARIFVILFNEIKEMFFAQVEQESVRKLALSVFRHLHSLSLRFHLDRKTGVITRSMERGAKALESAIRFSMFNIIPTAFEIVIVAVTLYIMYPSEYMLITTATLIAYGYYTISVTEWRAKQIRKMKEAENQSSFKSIESLLNYETVKYFTNEDYEAQKYNNLLKQYKDITVNNRLSLSVLNVGQGLIIALGLIAIMLLAYRAIQVGTMTTGDFVLVNMYLMQLYQPLSNLGFSYREIKLALVEMEKMFSLLTEKQEVQDKEGAENLKIESPEVKMSGVSFYYNTGREILSDVSFDLHSGKVLAIVGPSGSGKSTITRLIFRFYDVTGGEILVSGHNITDITQKSLRQAIGIVPQDTVLFNDTIGYNIRYGNRSATQSETENAAKIAEIHEFIRSLPEGYETVVGERGLKLSGGEKQRIAIARTVLKKPEIFIFDEATSSLDTRTEFAIQKSINKISAGKTTIIIAHRLSTIVHADEILVLQAGKVVERGKHVNLLENKGLYRSMWDQQKKSQHSA